MKHGSDWASIGAMLGRSASSVKDRYRLMKDTCNSGAYSHITVSVAPVYLYVISFRREMPPVCTSVN